MARSANASAALLIALLASGAAFGQVSDDQTMGRTFEITADQLPPPQATRSVSNGPRTLAYDGQVPIVPDGFSVTLFAQLDHPRRMLVLPDGDVVVAEQKPGHLTLLRTDGSEKVRSVERLAPSFNGPYGLAFRDGEILVADQDGLWSMPYPRGGAAKASMISAKGVFGAVRGHNNRPLAIDPKSGALYVGVGSMGNIAVEPDVKATIQRFASDGSSQEAYVTGVRNPCGLAIHPGTGDLWAVVQERDGLGDRLVPDFLIRAEAGNFHGWPYAYTGRNPQPGLADQAPEQVARSKVPDLLFQAHSSALDLTFYNGDQFPAAYRGDAFVALKGSWNSAQPTGYKVVRVPFKDGRPAGTYQNFTTGFWVSGTSKAEVWGRPAALAVTKDGALLIADDTAGTIWRVAFTGQRN